MICFVPLKETSASTLPPSSVITNRRPVHCPASQGVVADQLTRASDSFVARLIEIGKLHGFPINDRAPFMLDVKVVPRHSMISDNLCNSVTDHPIRRPRKKSCYETAPAQMTSPNLFSTLIIILIAGRATDALSPRR